MLTVLMATHNGAQTLPTVLDAYCQLEAPYGGWKLLIVNNASTDRTQEVLDLYRSRLPLMAISESAVGKNRALNTGLAKVEGDLVVMTDDDAVPHSDWLVQHRSAADAQSAFALFGGVVLPRWEVPPASWILPFQTTLSITDPAWEEGPTYAPRIYGPNMAIRTRVIEAGYRFDVSLGPIGSKYQMGDETDFLQRVNKDGFECWHVKRAIVEHMIRQRQMTYNSMLRRARANGRAEYRREHLQYAEPVPALLLGMPRYIVREIIEQSLRVARTRFTQGDKTFAERWRLQFLVGRALGGRDIYKFRRLMPLRAYYGEKAHVTQHPRTDKRMGC